MTTGSSTDGNTGTRQEYGTKFEYESDESVATTIALAVAQVTGREATELEPLGSFVDCEALDSLVTSAEPSLSVSFLYEGCRIFVSGNGFLEITRV
ncbi:HalOD1 output domain-containing protein [Haloarchaeobius sp. FL176]|uniref:HalOD1 output domain-containing protein n=1 Tax=Haloarchaeobius sp. FL176 TaxID=2967129 RepID=UPI0021477494|nr:HalOD1 output domain-containing protein [Haloarchaeobius sp. FL176]